MKGHSEYRLYIQSALIAIEYGGGKNSHITQPYDLCSAHSFTIFTLYIVTTFFFLQPPLKLRITVIANSILLKKKKGPKSATFKLRIYFVRYCLLCSGAMWCSELT